MNIRDEIYKNINVTGKNITDVTFSECEFIDCIFTKNDIRNCVFENCRFINCKVAENKFKFSKVKELYIEKCDVLGVNWSELTPNNSFIMPITSVIQSSFKYNTFTQMKLNKINIVDCDIIDTIFAECELKSADFNNTRFKRSEFFKCDMQKADFTDANGYQVDILNCNLKGAKFSFPDVCKLLDSLGIEYN